ncbi:hypothetical protein [Georgenia alba]|uniref:Nuclear transport factor 2 family protein n=1 Tax=Georgenia alba TaxID=2233858 RepID=A0ABW2Q3Z5_9MICO
MPSLSRFRDDVPNETITGYRPTAEEQDSLAAWWETYDGLAERSAVARMAELATFPVNVVSDDAEHRPHCGQWDRDHYVSTMSRVMGAPDGAAASDPDAAGPTPEGTFESIRTPLFLGPSIVVVFSRSTMTAGGETYHLDYADVLVRENDGWRFQTMIQPGWGEAMRSEQ